MIQDGFIELLDIYIYTAPYFFLYHESKEGFLFSHKLIYGLCLLTFEKLF